jgi:hypothetical protein
MDVIFPLISFLVVGTALLSIWARRFPDDEGAWLIRVLLAAFVLRLGAATMFAILPETRIFHEDASGYEGIGMAMAADWSGTGPPLPFARYLTQNYGFYYVSAVVYYIFGPYRPAVSYLNALLGTVNVLLVYRLSRYFFQAVVARRAAVLTAFFPSMILWSSVALKDPLMATLILVSLSGCVRLKRDFSVSALLSTVLPVIAMQPVRFYMVYFMLFALMVSLSFERGMRAVTGVTKQVLIGGAVIGLLMIVGFAGRAQEGMEILSLERASFFRSGMASTAASGFAGDVNISTPGRALAFLPVGVSVLLFAPFPWQFTSMRAIFAAPETILWWFLFPSLVRGLRYSMRKLLPDSAPLILFAITLTCAYSLVHGNVGSGFRQRAQIFVILFIFSSLGWYHDRARKVGLDEDVLLSDEAKARA